MSSKEYLSQQINLISLSTTDLFTEEEYDLYQKIIKCINRIGEEDSALKEDDKHDPTIRLDQITAKKKYQEDLRKLIEQHKGTPRRVQIKRILDTRRFPEGQWPEGITWRTLKTSRKISEFVSDESRMMGLKHGDITFDKVIIKWKSLDILEQIVLDGFILPVLNPDKTVTEKHLIFMTASSGQLRTDKTQFIEESMWAKIQPRLMCGLTFERINKYGGININKLMAYIALESSATLPWTDVSIDNCIVVDDFETLVTEEFDNINHSYQIERERRTVKIKHSDGIGMMLPKVSRKNMMLRGPWLKGLLTSFDFIRFCKVNNCPAVLRDIYGQKHDLEAEDITVILFKSQFKLWKYYENWDEYKRLFKENGCCLNVTNIEEDFIPNTAVNYQFIQELTTMTDEEIEMLIRPTHDKIVNIANDAESMLRALKADINSDNPYKRSLAMYPELLREAYTRTTLKDIKTRWMLDAKSGKIFCNNKRLYAIPDMYAVCEYLFLDIDMPEGLLKSGEVAAKMYRSRDIIDCLRSPSLSMEHWIANVVKDPEIYSWFYTNGLYMSCHDSAMMRLQGDWDGDQVNCVSEEAIIQAALRELEHQDVRTLNYELGKAPDKPITREEMFNGLKRAHENSGIGQVSNSITKIWNKANPDKEMTKILTYLNNVVIDAAKTGEGNELEKYPDVYKRFLKSIGGKRSTLPYFFQFSKNGRRDLHLPVKDRKTYSKVNNSTMNRICLAFDDIGKINFNHANVPPFNWQMLITDNDQPYNIAAVNTFCKLDTENKSNLASASYADMDAEDIEDMQGFEFVKEMIVEELTKDGRTLEKCYPSIVKYLFAGANMNKATHKQMFWRVFGDIAVRNLEENLKTYTECDKCGMKIPSWVKMHDCPKNAIGYFECVDCGAWCKRSNGRQIRCEACQTEFRSASERKRQKINYAMRKKSA